MDNYAYTVSPEAGLMIVDISNPASPKQMGRYDTGGTANAVAVAGDFAYVADGSAGLLVIDIRNPENPQKVGEYNTPGSATGVAGG